MATTSDNHKMIISMQDQASRGLRSLKALVGAVGAALGGWGAYEIFQASIGAAARFEGTMVSLRGVVESTGRSMTVVLGEMRGHMGGLATDANVATGFLKGMSTTLTTTQISDMTRAIRDASRAMGEDFNVQLPLIIKAVKQLNPAILDNIGVTVRLDQVNKKIREGFYGMGTAINETTQQHAIFTEIMRQTAIFAGQEERYLTTLAGKWDGMKVAAVNALKDLGQAIIDELGSGKTKDPLTTLTRVFKTLGENAVLTAKVVIGGISAMMAAVQEAAAFYERVAREKAAGAKELEAEVLEKEGKWIEASVAYGEAAKLRIGAVDAHSEAMKRLDDIVGKLVVDFKTWQDVMAAGIAGDTALKPIRDATDLIVSMTRKSNEQANKETQELKAGHSKAMLQLTHTEVNDQIDIHRQGVYARGQLEAEHLATVEAFQEKATQLMGQMVSTTTGILMSGRATYARVFKGMAQDFLRFFIQESLAKLASSFVPFVGKLLSSILDTPKYDHAVEEEGERFAMFLHKGMNRAMEGFGGRVMDHMRMPVGNGLGMMPAGAGAGGGGVQLNLTIHGTPDEHSLHTVIVPGIEQAARNLATDIKLGAAVTTGGPDVF